MDLALLSTRIFTGEPGRPWAEAVGVEQGKVKIVGNNQEVRVLCTPRTEVWELPGRLVVPGLIDGHAHFCFFGQHLSMVDLKGLTSLEQCRERIRIAVSQALPGEWVVGRGWDQHKWREKREPTRKDLDDLAPRNPLMMIRADGHTLWVNGLALQAAGITRHAPDPPIGKIERDPKSGEPSGILREAVGLFRKYLPKTTKEDWKKAALTAQAEALKVGLTGVHSCEMLPQYEALAELDREGRLKIRVYHLLRPHESEELLKKGVLPGSGTDRLWVGHMKLFADGSLGSGTALLHEPYEDDPSNRGLVVFSVEDLAEQIRLTYDWGGEVAIHAIGDRAVTHCLEAISKVRAERGMDGRAKRDRLEHVQLFRAEDLPWFKRLGVTASVQPVFMTTDWRLAEEKWGKNRCRRAYAWKTLLEAGVPLQFGSDAPFDQIAPIFGLQAAVTRMTPAGEPRGGWFPEEGLSLAQAITAFTTVPAWTAHRESELGTVSVGKRADFTVFEKDLFELPERDWPSTAVEMTIIDGAVVYRRGRGNGIQDH